MSQGARPETHSKLSLGFMQVDIKLNKLNQVWFLTVTFSTTQLVTIVRRTEGGARSWCPKTFQKQENVPFFIGSVPFLTLMNNASYLCLWPCVVH